MPPNRAENRPARRAPPLRGERKVFDLMNLRLACVLALGSLSIAPGASAARESLKSTLHTAGYKIAWECYVNGNWEIFVMNSDGTHPVNITKTPSVHEHYPQVSP